MKYAYLVKSNYIGENAQGHVLGVHGSKASAFFHFNMLRDDRKKRAKLGWSHGPEISPKDLKGMRWVIASFYVQDSKYPEVVELTRHLVCHDKAKNNR